MKSSSKRIFILILLVSIAMFSIVTVSASVVSTTQTCPTTDEGIQIEEKYKKVSKNKITFNANGGKIGSKNTVVKNINKGAKISKFPASPKRTGYNFKGWFVKKSGGTKISVNTKPTKSVSYYAQWTKKNANTKIGSKLLGNWETFGSSFGSSGNDFYYYTFNSNGTFEYGSVDSVGSIPRYLHKVGNYKVSNGKITFTNVVQYDRQGKKIKNCPDAVREYQILNPLDGSKKERLKIPRFDSDSEYVSISGGWVFYKK